MSGLKSSGLSRSTVQTMIDAGGPPTGAAGGDLAGTFPNPSVLRARALQSATSDVSVNGAAAPTVGQVLTATGPGAATWQTPTGGGTTTRREAAVYSWASGSVETWAVGCNPALYSSGGAANDADGNWYQWAFVYVGGNFTQLRWNPTARYKIKTGPGAAGVLGVQVHGWMYQQNNVYLENNQLLMYSDGTVGAHWFLRSRDGAAGVTAVDTGIVCAPNTVYDCTLAATGAGTLATLTINSTTVTCSTNLPTTTLGMGFQIGTLTQRTLFNRLNLSSD